MSSDATAADFFRGTIILAGGSDGLKPEESESYSIGFDWTPDFSDDLNVSMTYYDVDYSSAISLPTNIVKKTLRLNGYFLSEGVCQSLSNYFRSFTSNYLQELTLTSNGLKDAQMAILLRGITE